MNQVVMYAKAFLEGALMVFVLGGLCVGFALVVSSVLIWSLPPADMIGFAARLLVVLFVIGGLGGVWDAAEKKAAGCE